MKKIGLVLGALVLLVVVGAVVLLSNLGAVVKSGVERYGSEATQAKVTLDEASIQLTDGRATLRGLSVGNPKGYEMPTAFVLREVMVRLDPQSVTTDTIVLHEVLVASPQVTYEIGSGLKSNIAQIQDNIRDYGRQVDGEAAAKPRRGGKGGGKSGGGGKGEGASDPEDVRRYVVDDLRMTGGKVTLGTKVVDGGVRSVDIPDIHLTNLGRDEGGLTEAQLAVEILDALSTAAIQAAAKGQLEELGKGLLDKAKGVLDGVLKGR